MRQFAAHLGVSDRMVSKWEKAGAAIRPYPVNQAVLDTSLAMCTDAVRARFWALLRADQVPHLRSGGVSRVPGPRPLTGGTMPDTVPTPDPRTRRNTRRGAPRTSNATAAPLHVGNVANFALNQADLPDHADHIDVTIEQCDDEPPEVWLNLMQRDRPDLPRPDGYLIETGLSADQAAHLAVALLAAAAMLAEGHAQPTAPVPDDEAIRRLAQGRGRGAPPPAGRASGERRRTDRAAAPAARRRDRGVQPHHRAVDADLRLRQPGSRVELDVLTVRDVLLRDHVRQCRG